MTDAEILAVVLERDKLLAAIKEHHAQKADDRCWMDDKKLYAAADLPYPEENVTVESCSAMLKNCERYVELRMVGKESGWKSYAELEAELKTFREREYHLTEMERLLKERERLLNERARLLGVNV